MQLKIDESRLSDMVQKEIMDQIGEEARNEMIEAAIKYLMEPQKSPYGHGSSPSPLQAAFNSAIGVAASKIVHKMVAEDPKFQEKVKIAVGEAMLIIDKKNYSEHVASAIADTLKKGLN